MWTYIVTWILQIPVVASMYVSISPYSSAWVNAGSKGRDGIHVCVIVTIQFGLR